MMQAEEYRQMGFVVGAKVYNRHGRMFEIAREPTDHAKVGALVGLKSGDDQLLANAARLTLARRGGEGPLKVMSAKFHVAITRVSRDDETLDRASRDLDELDVQKAVLQCLKALLGTRESLAVADVSCREEL